MSEQHEPKAPKDTARPSGKKRGGKRSNIISLAVIAGLTVVGGGYILLDQQTPSLPSPPGKAAALDLRPDGVQRQQLAEADSDVSASLKSSPEAERIEAALTKLRSKDGTSQAPAEVSASDSPETSDEDEKGTSQAENEGAVRDPVTGRILQDEATADRELPALADIEAEVDKLRQRHNADMPLTREAITGSLALWGQALQEQEAERSAARKELLNTPHVRRMIETIGMAVGQKWDRPPVDLDVIGAVVAMKLDESGQIESLEIIRSAGHRAFNASVLSAARKAAPYALADRLTDEEREILGSLHLTFGTPYTVSNNASLAETSAAGQLPDAPLSLSQRTSHALAMSSQLYPPITHENFDYFDAAAFMRTVKGAVQGAFVPTDIENLAHDSTLEVTLTLPFGYVEDVQVVESSGSNRFDNAAVAAVDSVSPFSDVRQLSDDERPRVQHFRLHFWEGGVR